jgi:ATP-dependent DNA helicase RecQ
VLLPIADRIGLLVIDEAHCILRLGSRFPAGLPAAREQVAEWLRSRGIEAFAYHGNVTAEGFASSDAYRQHLEQRLMRNELKVLVATSALGMGYDKPDVGFVVHYQAPGSIVSYYQQVGRAGRGMDYAVGILMSGREDEVIQAYFRTTAFPPERAVDAILEALAGGDGMTGAELESALNLTHGQIEKVLKLLSVENPAPVIRHERRWVLTPVRWAGFDRDRIAHLTQQRELEWAELQAFVDSTGCLMAHLARALDDPPPADCGRCARCLGRPIFPVAAANELVHDAGRFLQTAETVLECRQRIAPGSFPQYGFTGQLLLVDDVVDSAWTVTVATVLLRRVGVQCVHPVALATTRHGD